MELYSLVGKAILATFAVVAAVLALVFLVVVIIRSDVDAMEILYLSAALITTFGAGISLIRKLWRQRQRKK